MGEVKIQLAEEALVDEAAAQVSQLKLSPQYLHPCRGQSRSGATSCTCAGCHQHEMSITLSPNQGAEVELEMKQDAKVN